MSPFIELLALYRWTLLGGLCLGIALSQLGVHLAARDRSLQTLCLSQGATLGTLLGIGFAFSWLPPIVFGLVVAMLTFTLTEWLAKAVQASLNSYFTAVFLLLLAACSLVSACFPSLETHLSQVFFGDLATLSNLHSKIAFAIGVTLFIGFKSQQRKLSRQSFELSVLAYPLQVPPFHLVTLLTLSLSIQYVGFLFTVACLFLPTTLASLTKRVGLNPHFNTCAWLAGLSIPTGFIASLRWPTLPTVPTLVAAFLFWGVFWMAKERVLSSRRVQ